MLQKTNIFFLFLFTHNKGSDFNLLVVKIGCIYVYDSRYQNDKEDWIDIANTLSFSHLLSLPF
jgi:hypothetical protein